MLALASDLNPGTTWCESMQMVLALACRYLRLTPAQAIAAATINAAKAVGLEALVGSLEPGKLADVLMLDVPDYRHLGYRYGTNLVQTVLKAGRVVIEDGIEREVAAYRVPDAASALLTSDAGWKGVDMPFDVAGSIGLRWGSGWWCWPWAG